MAAIGNIRKHYGLLVIIIGLALLAFVLGDLFKSTNKRQSTNVAIVNNEKITYQDYSNLVESNIENVKRNNNGNLSSEDNYSIHNNTLEQMIRDIIMEKEYKKLGITVSSDELYDQFLGENPNQYVVRSFQDENGNFNKEPIIKYLKNFENLSPEAKTTWLNFEKAIKEDRLNTKYENLLKKGFYVPAKLAERYYSEKNDKTSAEVYAIRYSTIQDSTVVVDETDNKKFYDENKGKYYTDATRSIDYVIFEIKPSDEDIQDAKEYIEDLKEDFTSTTNTTNFVNANSDIPYDSTWKGRKDLPIILENIIFDENNEKGFVYGPYEDNGYYNVVKIMDFADRSDSLMASHILISYKDALRSNQTRTKDAAQALADSVLNVVKNNKNIDELAASLSDDPSAKTNKGDLGWFTDGMMVNAFNEFVQNNKVGTVGMVETPFGFHIIKVTNRTEAKPKVRIAVIAHEISPSTNTYQTVFAEVNRFATENKTIEQFNSAIETQGLSKRTYPTLKSNTYHITGIDNPRQIVRWAFDNKTQVGDISTIFDLDNMYVIAALTKIVQEGTTPYEDIIERYTYQIKKEKKGKILAEKIKVYGTDYQKMIDELNGEKTTVDNVTFEGRGFGNFGVEDKVIGSVTGMKEGNLSEPIVGGNGLYVVKVTKHHPAAATTDYSNILKEKKSRFNNAILNQSAYSALKDNTKIVDNSLLFY